MYCQKDPKRDLFFCHKTRDNSVSLIAFGYFNKTPNTLFSRMELIHYRGEVGLVNMRVNLSCSDAFVPKHLLDGP